MAVYGNTILRKSINDNNDYVPVDEFVSIVYNEYLYHKSLLESCVDNSERTVLETKLEILYEVSIKDIISKIKELWKRFRESVRELFNNLSKKIKELKSKIRDSKKSYEPEEKEKIVNIKFPKFQFYTENDGNYWEIGGTSNDLIISREYDKLITYSKALDTNLFEQVLDHNSSRYNIDKDFAKTTGTEFKFNPKEEYEQFMDNNSVLEFLEKSLDNICKCRIKKDDSDPYVEEENITLSRAYKIISDELDNYERAIDLLQNKIYKNTNEAINYFEKRLNSFRNDEYPEALLVYQLFITKIINNLKEALQHSNGLIGYLINNTMQLSRYRNNL